MWLSVYGAQSIKVNSTKTYDKQCYIMMDSALDTVALDIFQKIYNLFKFYAAIMTKLSVTELS